MKKKTPFINLQTGLFISVDGKAQEDHTLSWEILREIGDGIQDLINTLAKFSLTETGLSEEYTKLVFTGFYKGSAVPAWRIPPPPPMLFPVEKEINQLNADVSDVVKLINDGNFQEIADRYTEPSVKNTVVDAVYKFTNAAGTTPLKIVRKDTKSDKFRSLAKIRVMTPKQKLLLKVEDKLAKASKDPESVEAVGKFLINKTNKGRTTKKSISVYTQKEASLALRFDTIETEKELYILKSEVVFVITADNKKYVNAENSLLDIYATGDSMEETERDIFEQFDYTYKRLTKIDDDKLSAHLLAAKKFITLIVDYVKQK